MILHQSIVLTLMQRKSSYKCLNIRKMRPITAQYANQCKLWCFLTDPSPFVIRVQVWLVFYASHHIGSAWNVGLGYGSRGLKAIWKWSAIGDISFACCYSIMRFSLLLVIEIPKTMITWHIQYIKKHLFYLTTDKLRIMHIISRQMKVPFSLCVCV